MERHILVLLYSIFIFLSLSLSFRFSELESMTQDYLLSVKMIIDCDELNSSCRFVLKEFGEG